MTSLIDTNVLVYRHDARDPAKQQRALSLLRTELAKGTAWLCHQSLVEFYAAVTRPRRGAPGFLTAEEARTEIEQLLSTFPVLYPSQPIVRLAVQGVREHQLSWWDSHLWAYAQRYRISILYSEDFQHDRTYGTVRVVNPFLVKD